MAHWASYIAFSFNSKDSKSIFSETKEALGQYDDKIAWHQDNYMHLTLQFMGWTTSSDAQKIGELLSFVDTSQLNINLTGQISLLGFENQKEYIALKAQATPQLLKIREDIGVILKENNLKCKDQDFIPHISLGRVHNLDNIGNEIVIKPKVIKPIKLNLFESISQSISLNNRENFNPLHLSINKFKTK